MSYYIIYKTINLVNGKIYVGKHKQEISGFDGYLGSGVYLNNAINRYGEENFIRETLEVCVSSCLNEREIYWIEALSSYNPEYPERGYNLTKGGGGCIGIIRNFSDETKEKMSISAKNKFWTKEHYEKFHRPRFDEENGMFNRRHKKSSINKMKEKIKNRDYSGNKNPNFNNGDKIKGNRNGMYGKRHDFTTLEKMSNKKLKYIYKLGGKEITLFDIKQFCLKNKLNYKKLESKFWGKTGKIVFQNFIFERIRK